MDRPSHTRFALLLTTFTLATAAAFAMIAPAADADSPAVSHPVSHTVGHTVRHTVATAPAGSAVRAPYVAAARRQAALPRVKLTGRWARSTTPVPVCAAPTPGHPTCLAVGRKASAPTASRAARPAAYNAPGSTFNGYEPADIQAAYGTAGETAAPLVAIVDAYGDPSAETDLATYRAQFGLPACTTANGCFLKVDQNGGTNYPSTDGQGANGWIGETSLDLDAVSAVCPACHILLVQANNDTTLDAAVHEATALGATYVSMSWGTDEADLTSGDIPSLRALDAQDYAAPGVTYVAASGDESYTYEHVAGGGLNWPASSPNVVAAGGVSLNRNATTGSFSPSAWSDGGSGCSKVEPAQPWQQSTASLKAVCSTGRAAVDVSADADPYTGLSAYVAGTWSVFGGTSLATPLLTALYAVNGETVGSSTGAVQANEYAHPSGLVDVTTGSNGSCGNALCTAGVGWDGPTGLGTPTSPSALFTSRAPAVSATWPSFTYGTSATVPVTVTAEPAPMGTVTLLDGSTTLATAHLSGTDTTQTVDLAVPRVALSPGTHTLTLAYAGDNGSGGDSISHTVTVAKATSTLSAVWPAAATYGKAFTVTATVRGAVSPSASGTVTLTSGSTTLARAYVPAGSAVSKTVSLPVRAGAVAAGQRTLRVAYSGDADLTAATTPAHTVVVRKATPTLTASWPSTARVASRFAVKVTIRVTGIPLSSGMITLRSGGRVVAKVRVPAGAASSKKVTVMVAARSLARGRHTLTLAYSGDANVNPWTSSHVIRVI